MRLSHLSFFFSWLQSKYSAMGIHTASVERAIYTYYIEIWQEKQTAILHSMFALVFCSCVAPLLFLFGNARNAVAIALTAE